MSTERFLPGHDGIQETGQYRAFTPGGFGLEETVAAPVAFNGTIDNQQGTQNVPFSLDVSGRFSGTATPFTYSVLSGTLPTGLSLNTSSGVISGTPTVVQNQTGIVIQAEDTNTATADSNSFAINIVAEPSANGVIVVIMG